MSVNHHNKWVTLDQLPQEDGVPEALNPPGVWASIQPSLGRSDGRVTDHVVEMRFHPEVTFGTRITFGSRQLFVRGFQNVDEANDLLVLACEEIR